jgi:hypothetical protein
MYRLSRERGKRSRMKKKKRNFGSEIKFFIEQRNFFMTRILNEALLFLFFRFRADFTRDSIDNFAKGYRKLRVREVVMADVSKGS